MTETNAQNGEIMSEIRSCDIDTGRCESEKYLKLLAEKENEIQRLVDSQIDEESMLRKQLAERDAEIAAIKIYLKGVMPTKDFEIFKKEISSSSKE